MLEMILINWKISLQFKWSRKCIIVARTANYENPTFQINDTKLYVPIVTLSSQENRKLVKQLESGFKRTIHWNKYLAKTTNQARNRYLDYRIDTSFQGVNRLFVLSFKDHDGLDSHKQYHLLTVKKNNLILWSMEENFFINQ